MRHALQYGADDFFVEVFERLNLLFHVAHVAGFVRGFDVNEDQVIFFQRTHAVLAFADVIGIEKPGDARHVDALQSGVDTQTVDNIDGGNHPAFDAESFGQRRQLRRSPLPPEPDRRRLAVSFSMAFSVYRMVCQYRLGSLHELQQARRAVALGHIAGQFSDR